MCRKAVVFAGTTEGREIAEYLSSNGVEVVACTATQYGGKLLEGQETTQIHSGRMDREEMCRFFIQEQPYVTIDATHPYAVEVTKNIKSVCKELGYTYLRICREDDCGEWSPGDSHGKDVVWVDSVEEAAAYLEKVTGNVLIATGSKELMKFTNTVGFQERYYARVLSSPEVMENCIHMGFHPSHLFAMQGPFSMELNLALLKQVNASYFVTKESGKAGGFREKWEAAKQANAVLVVVGRPPKEEGLLLEAAKARLRELYHILPQRNIHLVGVGVGGCDTVTGEGERAIKRAELIIGAERMLREAERIRGNKNGKFYGAYTANDIRLYLEVHPEAVEIVIVLSGDIGFYSGAKKLIEELPWDVKVIPGISSLSYFAAKLKTSWDDVKSASLHGKKDNVIGYVQNYGKVFVLLGKEDDVSLLCQKLTDYGMGEARVSVGECLGYEEECIRSKAAREWQDIKTNPLGVCLVEYQEASNHIVTCGISDDWFIREKVPMTKEEIRCIALSKLKLKKDAVCYDVGAGTGSISIEAAKAAVDGMVYAVEKNPLAICLIGKNCRRFGTDNVVTVEGTAPEALLGLPVPTHAFIGGSNGNLEEILDVILKKNPKVRVVITAVSLETVSEAFLILKKLPLVDLDIVWVSVSKSREVGSYHMMTGLNPVAIFSFTGEETGE